MKKFFCYLLIIGTLFSSIINFNTITVSADGDFASLLTPYLGHTPSSEEEWTYSYIITSLKTDGLDANMIAGVLGNIRHEAGGCPFAVEGMYTSGAISACGKHYRDFQVGQTYNYGDYTPPSSGTSSGNGHGLVQWSFGRADNLTNFCASLPDGIGFVTVTHKEFTAKSSGTYKTATRKIPDVAGQVLFMLQELNGSENAAKQELLKATSASDAAEIFRSKYERGGTDSKEERKNSAVVVLPAVEACTGLTGTPGGSGSPTEEGMQSVAEAMYASGYWTEDQLSAYCKLTEINIQELYLDGATREALTQDELSGLANWQLNVRMQEEEHGFIRFLRTLSMFIGIILVVWAMLFYTAYWIDKTNNILPIEFVFLLSFGKLRISGDESDSTYSFNSENSAKVKMINHKDCIFICVIAVGAGFLLITGIFYSIVQGFVNKALQFLGRV